MSAGVVLVTGGSGALGGRLIRELSGRGLRTRSLVHRRPVEGADETFAGELGDRRALERAATGADAVVHLAALTHSRRAREYARVNRDGTRNVVEACASAAVRRLVHVSTRAISPDGGAYSRSKHEAEQAVRDGAVPWVIVRLPEVYGTGGGEGVDRIVAAARAGSRIPLVGAGGDEVCPMFVDDAVHAIASAVTAPGVAGRELTLAGECMTVRGFAERCAAHFGAGSRTIGVPVAVVGALGVLGRLVPVPVYPDQLERLLAPKPAPTPDAGRELGIQPRRLDEGLRTMERGA